MVKITDKMQVEIGKRIKNCRKQAGLTQKQFAQRIFVSDSLLSAIETGRVKITKRTLKALCETFQLNETWLVTGNGTQHGAQQNELDAKLNNQVNQLNQHQKQFVSAFLKQLYPNLTN